MVLHQFNTNGNKNPCQRQDLRRVLVKRLVHLPMTEYQYCISELTLVC